MLEESKYFIILAGPNGAGKSTLATDLIYKRYKVQTFDWDKEFELEWKRFQFDPQVEQGVRDKVSDDFISFHPGAFAAWPPFPARFLAVSHITSYFPLSQAGARLAERNACLHSFTRSTRWLWFHGTPIAKAKRPMLLSWACPG